VNQQTVRKRGTLVGGNRRARKGGVSTPKSDVGRGLVVKQVVGTNTKWTLFRATGARQAKKE